MRIPTPGPISWGHQRMPAAIALGLLMAFVFAQSGFPQSDPPLNFAQNFLVRGDFVVAGAQGLTTNFDFNNGLAIGTITVPDPNPGITGQNMVPPGAEVIDAKLYWQTVEKLDSTAGNSGTGQNGFFRPLINGGPKAPGYPIIGVPLGGNNTVSWSNGGCTTGSTGKVVRTYRANVLNALPRDSNNVISANSANVTYEVRLPGTSSTTPIAVFATLVLVYRVLDSSVPLNFILIYDGDTATSATSLTMTQTLKHFYDAAHNPVSRLAHIVGNGKSKKTETVSLNGVPLPSLYPGQPPYVAFYGTGDNPVWTFGNPNVPAIPNPIQEDSDVATTQVMASGMNPGCQSFGAIILSTTVKNTDGDGLPDAVKKAPPGYPNPGYCDADKVCAPGDPNWVDLPGAVLGTALKPHPDVYVQLDYMCSSPNPDGLTCKTGDGINYSFDPTLQIDPADGLNAVQKVVNVYAAHGITLHVNPPGTNQPNVHAIQEPGCQDTMVNGQLSLCTYPHPSNPPGNTINLGVVAWPGDVYGFERQLIDPDDPTNLNDCATSPPAADCVPRFQPAAALAKHYGVFAHAVGQPTLSISNGSLVSVTQSDNTVTFTASTPVGALNMLVDEKGNSALDPSCNNGRITVIGAITNPNLNGTHCINPGFNPAGTMFTITVSGPKALTSYTSATDPLLAVVPPFTTTASGSADVGGHHFVVSLGRWENPASPNSDGQNPLVIAGTIMHEGGHDWMGYGHGGPTKGAAANPQLFQSVTTNCKPNYLSVMSYSRQVDGVLDYSESTLGDLNKATQTGNLTGAGSATANWYVPWPLVDANGNQIIDPSTGKPIGSPAKLSCPGGPIPAGEQQMTRVTGPANTFSFVGAPDPNYDGNPHEDLQGACDWCEFDLGQNGATSFVASSSGGQFGGGGPQFGGGGGQFGGGGGQFGGGGGQFGGGGGQFGGGGGQFGGGGGQFGGGGEIDLATAESITHAITDLTVISEGASPRTITLRWTKPFGEIGAYNVYRSKNGGPFTLINVANTGHTLVGNPPVSTFMDTVTCAPAPGGYRYFVTAVQSATSPFPGEESTPSNTVSTIAPDTTHPLTGCYIVTGFSSPASAVQGSAVPITWTLTDDFYPTANPVTRQAANTLVAIGPLPNNCTTPGRTTLLADGMPTASGVDSFTNVANQFTFTWKNTDAFCAGSYTFELDLDHVPASPAPVPAQVQTTASPLLLNIDVTDTDSTPHIPTTSLSNGVVGTPYSNTLSEDGGTPPFTWTSNGSLPPGITLNSVSGLLSGTPTAAGTFTFTVTVTDSAGNMGTQTLTLNVADALFGDLIVVDGSPSANSGTVFRITPDGTVTATIANISNGSPTGVAVDPSGGNIYVAVAGGTHSVVKVTQFGATSNFVSGGVLQNPVAVAVDASGNVYVGDNKTDAVYKFNSAGAQVDATGNATTNPFASLPGSPNTLQDIRMAFDSAGNLTVASDSIGDVSGVVEVDKITPTGAFSALYNALTNSTFTDALTAASSAAGGNTTYTGTFSPILPAGSAITISGFTNLANNGPFTIVSCTSTQLVVNNPSGIAETNPGTATFNPSGLSLAIGTVGGIAVFADGSIDVADFGAKSIFKITNPGIQSMAITKAVNGPAISATALCCNISGMANSPSQQPSTTDLYVTLNGVGGPAAQLQLAVPETDKVTTVVSGAPLTFPNDVASYSFPGVTYYVDGNANFGTLNLGNGSTKIIGAGTVLGTGIDVTPTGQVYVEDFFNHLYQMNTSTGAATLVGTGSIPAADFFTTGGLTNGSYFGVDASSGNLYSINLSTGATTLVGLTGTAKLPPGCALETTMAGSATVLYYTIGFHNGKQVCSSPMPDTLYAINPTTGATTTIGPVSVNGSGVNSFPGSGYVNGRLYAFTGGGKEYIIDTATGAATFVTNTTPAVFGAGSTGTGLSF